MKSGDHTDLCKPGIFDFKLCFDAVKQDSKFEPFTKNLKGLKLGVIQALNEVQGMEKEKSEFNVKEYLN